MYKLFLPLLLIILFIFQGFNLNAQKIKVVTLSIQDVDNKLLVKYDLVKSKENQRFKVTLEITSSSGNQITIKSVSGDVGDNIPGGPDKQIIWDYNADGIVLQDRINIEIFAELVKGENDIARSVKPVNAILWSTLWPGLGMTKIEKGKPYWLVGVVAYGTLGYSYLLNKKASNSYNDYLENTDEATMDKQLSDSQKQDNLSKTMAYTAIGIWGVNLIWTAIKAKNSNKKNISLSNKQNFNFYTGYDPYTRTAGFKIRIDF